jgi:GntR family transcriptional repressor for pyruvate dehydrogenase complex
MIFSGELGPDDWLPPARELAQKLGIAVLTLRVGLKELESAGYIATTRGSRGGSRVRDIETLSQRWIEWMNEKAGEIDDLWEFREIVETSIAALAAERRTQAELAEIERALIAAADDSHTAVLRWNVVFHDALARAAHSRHLQQAMEGVRMELFLPAGLLLRRQPADDLRRAHAHLFDAVRDCDPGRARETMHRHLSQTRQSVAAALAELAGGGLQG